MKNIVRTSDRIEVVRIDGNNVDHPQHYNVGGIEVIDAIEAWGFGEGFNRGNAIKYIARAGRKNPETAVEDLEKARWYIDREIERLSELGGQHAESESENR